MPIRSRLSLFLLTAVCFLFTLPLLPVWGAEASAFKTYLMDAENKIVRSVSLPSGTVAEFPKLEQSPILMVPSPDGTRLLVFEYSDRQHNADVRANGGRIMRYGKPNSLSIFDTRDMKLAVHLEDVGWNAVAQPAVLSQEAAISAAWDASGRLLTILAWGKKEKNPEIIQLDIVKGSIAARRPLACEAGEVNSLLQISPDTAAVLYGKRVPDKNTTASHKLLFINLKNLEDSKEISLPGIPREVIPSTDGDHVFVLSDDGNKIKEPGQAHLHIVSVAQGTLVQSIDGGFSLVDSFNDAPKGLTWIVRIGKTGASTLFAFEKGKVKSEIEIPDIIVQAQMAPKTRKLYLLCYDSVQVIDLDTLKLAGNIPTPHRVRGFWESGTKNRPPSNLAFDSAENIGVMGYSGDDEMSVLDLKNYKVNGTIDLMSGKRAFASIMLVAVATGAIGGAGSAAAGVPVAPVFVPNLPSTQYSPCIIDPSGQFVYIARMARVYIVDLKTYKKVEGIHINFNAQYAFLPPPIQGQRPLMFVFGSRIGFTNKVSYRIDAVDMATKEKLPDQEWRGHCLYTSDGKYAVNFDSENLYLLDGATLSTVKKIGGFKELQQILLTSQR